MRAFFSISKKVTNWVVVDFDEIKKITKIRLFGSEKSVYYVTIRLIASKEMEISISGISRVIFNEKV